MSLRQQNLGSIIKPGYNPLATPTLGYTYYLMTWGDNTYGQLATGNTTKYSSPKQVGALTDWLKLSGSPSGQQNAIKTDGTLWAWGNNNKGQLGQSDTTNRSSPVQVGGLTNWLTVSGNYSMVAIKTDGTLWTWGDSTYGQLGLGNRTNYSSPKQVGALTTWAYATSSSGSMYAVRTDGTLWVWGNNSNGKLGLGNLTQYSSPKQVGALTNWRSVSAGYSGGWAAAIKTDGTLWTWGYNAKGNLGLNNITLYSSPKQVGALTNWATISTGNYFCLATNTTGNLLAWGANYNGNLGLGTRGASAYYSSPKQVGALTNWSIVAAGDGDFSLAIKTDGTLWSWGSSSAGALGQGNTTQYSSPKQVGSLARWFALSTGNNNAVSALMY